MPDATAVTPSVTLPADRLTLGAIDARTQSCEPLVGFNLSCCNTCICMAE